MSLPHLSAAAIAAAVGAGGALLGVMLRGAFDSRLLRRQLAQAEKQAERQSALAKEQLVVQRELALEQLAAQREIAREQLEEQREARKRDRSEARAQSNLHVRREAYTSVSQAFDRLFGCASSWYWERSQLEKVYPGKDWDNEPIHVPDSLGIIEQQNQVLHQLSAWERAFLPAGQARNPVRLAAMTAGKQRTLTEDALTSLIGASAELRLVAPARMTKLIPSYSELPMKSTDPLEEIEKFQTGIWRKREEFVTLARADLGGDVGAAED